MLALLVVASLGLSHDRVMLVGAAAFAGILALEIAVVPVIDLIGLVRKLLVRAAAFAGILALDIAVVPVIAGTLALVSGLDLVAIMLVNLDSHPFSIHISQSRSQKVTVMFFIRIRRSINCSNCITDLGQYNNTGVRCRHL